MNTLLAVAGCILVLNLPFGFWRAGLQKFTLRWFTAVHLPVFAVAALRIFAGIGWHLSTFPALVGSYFAGQFLGGMLRRRTEKGK